MGGEHRLQPVPNRHRHLLRRGLNALQPRHIEVQVLVVEVLHDVFLEDSLEVVEVDEVPRHRVWHPFHGHVQIEVVPVPIRIAALAERLLVARVVPRGNPQPVRGIEPDPPGDVNRPSHAAKIRPTFAA